MSNKKLFEIRNIKPRSITIWVVLFFLLICILITTCVSKKSGFLKFHDKEQYKPLNEQAKTLNDSKGMYAKINFMLAEALKEKEGGYSVDNLNATGDRLKFYSPMTADYLVDKQEIRLDGFIPKDSIEAQFFYNSAFKGLLDKQKENRNMPYFKIEWEKGTNPAKIKSITIDETVGNMALLNDKWQGQITLDDPFLQIDTNVVYLIKDNMPIPLFSSNLPLTNFTTNQFTDGGHYTIRIAQWNEKLIADYEQIYKRLNRGNNSSPLEIIFNQNPNPNSSIQRLMFLNTGEHIYLANYNLWIQIGNDTTWIRNQRNNIELPNFENVLKITVKNSRGTNAVNATFYIAKNPFSVASKLVADKRTHINEKYCDLFTQQEILHLESNMKQADATNVHLSSNIFLSKILEDAITQYVDSISSITRYRWNDNDEIQMSVCLMDIETGEIIAAPYYSNRFKDNNLNEIAEVKNFNLENHHIGSSFKPLLTFAAAAKYPNLEHFILTNANFVDSNYCTLLGYTTPSYGADDDGNAKDLFWAVGNYLNRSYFLGHSHDNYPIAMTMLALTEPQDQRIYSLLRTQNRDQNWNAQINNLYNLLGNEGTHIKYNPRLPEKDRVIFLNGERNAELGSSSFAYLLSNLYDIQSETRIDTLFYSDKKVWQKLEFRNSLFTLYPDEVNLHLDKIGINNDFRDFQTTILGEYENKWNNVKLAEAYSRLLSKRATDASFIANSDVRNYLFENPQALFNKNSSDFPAFTSQQQIETAWTNFMRDWQNAVQAGGKGNTLTPAYNRFSNSFSNANELGNYHFYCKTGTPDETPTSSKYINVPVDGEGNRYVYKDEGVFVFGITNTDTEQPQGIVGVVYIKHISTKKGGKGVESSTARDFLTADLYKKIMFYNKTRFER
ncbi:MAG: hypothetical protein LBS01_00870 [Prevotellaceae bacterium]|jgi:hypothetical protein|nr:hypothetical protein [Prevotellaceae bacterium]